jgi:hypothetical protein
MTRISRFVMTTSMQTAKLLRKKLIKRERPRPQPGTDQNCQPLSNTEGDYGTFFIGANPHRSRFEQARIFDRFMDFAEN